MLINSSLSLSRYNKSKLTSSDFQFVLYFAYCMVNHPLKSDFVALLQILQLVATMTFVSPLSVFMPYSLSIVLYSHSTTTEWSPTECQFLWQSLRVKRKNTRVSTYSQKKKKVPLIIKEDPINFPNLNLYISFRDCTHGWDNSKI